MVAAGRAAATGATAARALVLDVGAARDGADVSALLALREARDALAAEHGVALLLARAVAPARALIEVREDGARSPLPERSASDRATDRPAARARLPPF